MGSRGHVRTQCLFAQYPRTQRSSSSRHLSSILSSCNSTRNEERPQADFAEAFSDNGDEEILETVSLCLASGVDGIVATNTTIKRPAPLSTQSRKAFK